jgi:alpha-tubulin suppressor-like RCC1 family protein
VVRGKLLLLACTVSCGLDGLVLSNAPLPPGDAAADASRDQGNASGVFAGQSFTCALVEGQGWCFGANVDGALGSGDVQTHLSPARLATPAGFDEITAGENHTCGLEHGTAAIWCWGYNASGQLGLGDVTARAVPTRLPMPARAIAVAAGYNHTCAIAADRSLWCWGDNTEGQLGRSDAQGAPNALSPARVGANADWLGVSGGQGHTCAIEAPGSMWCWGRNTRSETGADPSTIQLRTPTRTGAFVDWKSLDVGQDASCAIRSDGSLWCWGDNQFGQLGSAPSSMAVVGPAQVGASADWAQISLDTFSACALKIDHSLWCWGRNVEGQLGLGDTRDRYAPTQVGSLTAWTSMSVGRFHACAGQADGRAWCMGENSSGQLGLGDTVRRSAPTWVSIGVGGDP